MVGWQEHLSASIWAMVMRGIPNKQQTIAQSNPSFHAEIRLNPTIIGGRASVAQSVSAFGC
ncbi:unnamed protein product [Brugia pahangi]|uniref:Uncharacterized protein n=1 Tax=Brugia pahangi TaxID=6280 RepID=A0A0N4THP0_BRUPA|nr:unnamed protein product [Brugia pahangi]